MPMVCDGPGPDASCPLNRAGRTYCKFYADGELDLCKDCAAKRFPTKEVNKEEIRTLADISKINPNCLVATFMKHLDLIYQYGMKDIEDTLGGFSTEDLASLHRNLCKDVMHLIT